MHNIDSIDDEFDVVIHNIAKVEDDFGAFVEHFAGGAQDSRKNNDGGGVVREVGGYVTIIFGAGLDKINGNSKVSLGPVLIILEVLLMARKTVRVDIPRNPEKCIELMDNVLEKHDELGANSPLNALPMDELAAKATPVRAKQKQAKDMERELNKVYGERDVLLGDGTQSPDTVRFILAQARDTLLGVNRKNPRLLGDWGFDVTEGEATASKKAASPTS